MDATEIQKVQKKTYDTVKAAFQNETHLFIHVHFRGYDEEGQGINKNARFFDRYGAPIDFEDTWTEGYRSIEQHLMKHNKACLNKYTYFPLIGGYGGGAHLYKKYNHTNPWNWTGWIPRHQHLPYNAVSPKPGGAENVMYSNRVFLCLRGNEIQNDMWDYDPDVKSTDEEVKGPYRGGYWYNGDENYAEKKVASRYLHIISLKTFEDTRYNYIVHPLAYRILLNVLPDCGVDYFQWSVNNITKENNFKPKGDWGSKVNGIELFNDYT